MQLITKYKWTLPPEPEPVKLLQLTEEGFDLLNKLGFDDFMDEMQEYFDYKEYDVLEQYILNWKEIF